MKLAIGDVIGLWTVRGFHDPAEKRGRKLANCVCECGTERDVNTGNLEQGLSTGCGCKRLEVNANRLRRHGHKSDPLYQTWSDMVGRCTNPKYANYKLYGGRGVSVYPAWLSFEVFRAYMGPRPGPAMSIDRVDNNGDYAPWNVRWATQKEQCRNTRANVDITLEGQTRTAVEWSEKLGISQATLYYRMSRGPSLGMSHAEAVLSSAEEFRRLSRTYKSSNNNNKGKS